MTIALV